VLSDVPFLRLYRLMAPWGCWSQVFLGWRLRERLRARDRFGPGILLALANSFAGKDAVARHEGRARVASG
jgi:hypothetical protein